MSISLIDGPKLKRLFKFLHKSRLNVYITLLAKGILERFFANNFKFKTLDMVAVGQSHLDAAWRWTRKQGILKARATFKKALDHIDVIPEFTFAQPSPAYYQWMKTHFPHIYERIKKAVKAGRWILMGGMWVESDTNVPSGESLVRQRLYGMRFFQEEFGKMPDVEFLQDCFGFNRNLPQILAKSGARIFGTGKVPFWNLTNKGLFPSGILRWRGPDGSVLPTLLIYFGYLLPILYGKQYPDIYRLIKPSQMDFQADYTVPVDQVRAVQSDQLMIKNIFGYGLGDGGHGPVEAEIAIVKGLRALYPKRFRFYREGDFFNHFRDQIPRWLVWTDEIYLETHRGTYTTHGLVKKANRENEALLDINEKLHTIAALLGYSYPNGALTENWKKILFNQFHDIIPGSSIPEVYQDAHADYAQVYEFNRENIDRVMEFLTYRTDIHREWGTPFLLFNSLSWDRENSLVLEVDSPSNPSLVRDIHGNPLSFQVLTSPQVGKAMKKIVSNLKVPAFGFSLVYVSDQSPQEVPPKDKVNAVTVTENKKALIMENDWLKVHIDANTGYLLSFFDKTLNRELMAGPSKVISLFQEKSHTDAWNIDPKYLDHPIVFPEVADEVEITHSGPIRATITIKKTHNQSTFTQRVSLDHTSKALEISMDVDWHETNTLFKLAFRPKLDVSKTNRISSDIPYAFIDRTAHPLEPLDKARWEHCGQQWVELDDGEVGISFLNNSKYGYSYHDGTLYLTVLRGPPYPGCAKEILFVDPDDPSRPKFTDQHLHENITYVLFAHGGDWRGETWKRALELNNPITAISSRLDESAAPLPSTGSRLPLDESLIKINCENVQVAVLKAHEDGIHEGTMNSVAIRMVERVGETCEVTATFHPLLNPKEIFEVDLLEFNPRQIEYNKSGTFKVSMSAYEIKTLLLKL